MEAEKQKTVQKQLAQRKLCELPSRSDSSGTTSQKKSEKRLAVPLAWGSKESKTERRKPINKEQKKHI